MKATRKNSKAGRFYTINGEQYPSVTTILGAVGKPQLVPWAAKVERELVLKVATEVYKDDKGHVIDFSREVIERLGKTRQHEKLLTAAGDIGTELHAHAEAAFRTDLGLSVETLAPLGPEATIAFESFNAWRKDTGFKATLTEKMVHSETHGFAGTLDFGGIFEGTFVIGDLKTSKGLYLEHMLQVAAYRAALLEMAEMDTDRDDIPVSTGGLLVKLPKTAGGLFETRFISPSEIGSYFKVFLAVKELWTAMQEFDKPLTRPERHVAPTAAQFPPVGDFSKGLSQ